ncbi:MAG: hypothetical protein OEU26_24015 [Candidatus Tectomicrobia bacterium]|nr:hypothetical protein [Candidatus Tectomicrobia bacterium]
MGQTLLLTGTFPLSRTHLREGIDLYKMQPLSSTPSVHTGLSPIMFRCANRDYMAWVLWCQGYPDQALAWRQGALHLAQEANHPLTLARTLHHFGLIHHRRREVQAAHDKYQAALDVATEHGFPFWAAVATIMRGAIMAMAGELEDGIKLMEQGLATHRPLAEIAQTLYFGHLAEAYGQQGRIDEALDLVAQAQAFAEQRGEQEFEAELHRIKGNLLLVQVPSISGKRDQKQKRVDAETSFEQAIAIARRQAAKSWELRATVSLCRLWRQQGQRAKARQRLAPLYGKGLTPPISGRRKHCLGLARRGEMRHDRSCHESSCPGHDMAFRLAQGGKPCHVCKPPTPARSLTLPSER